MSGSFPALGFDPAPGDPDEVGRMSRHIGRAAAELDRLALEVSRLSDVSASWRGSAADAFAESATVLPRQLHAAAAAFGAAAGRLSGWSAELSMLQAEARAAERQAAAALQVQAAAPRVDVFSTRAVWTSTPPFGVHAPAVAAAIDDLQAARARAERVRAQARASARTAAAAVREAASKAPPAPVLERLRGWADAPFGMPVGQWVRDHEDALGVVADVTGTAAVGAALIPVVGLPVSAVLGGAALVSHGVVAAYAGGSLTDVGVDVAGFATLGVARVAHAGATRASGVVQQRWQSVEGAAEAGGDALSVVGVADVARRRLGSPPPPPAPACRTIPERRSTPESKAARRALHELLVVPATTPR